MKDPINSQSPRQKPESAATPATPPETSQLPAEPILTAEPATEPQKWLWQLVEVLERIASDMTIMGSFDSTQRRQFATDPKNWNGAPWEYLEGVCEFDLLGHWPPMIDEAISLCRILHQNGDRIYGPGLPLETVGNVIEAVVNTLLDVGIKGEAMRNAWRDFATAYPEATTQDVVSEIFLGADAFARHIESVQAVSKIKSAICDLRGYAIRETPKPAVLSTNGPHEAENIFKKEPGDYWRIRYCGGTPCRIRDRYGLVYIHHLLQNPKKDVSAVDLYLLTHPRKKTFEQSNEAGSDEGDEYEAGNYGSRKSADKADRAEALRAYTKGLKEYDDEIAKAKRNEDYAAEDEWKRKKKETLREFRKAKKTTQPEETRMMDAVYKRINATIKHIKETDQNLFEHLDGCIRRGWQCKYHDPGASPIDWDLL